MLTFNDIRRLSATLVFDLEDRFARGRGVRGFHPRPLEPVKFLATARIEGGVRKEIVPPLELVVTRNGGGYHLFFGTARRHDGERRERALTDGLYAVRVEGRFYQSAERVDVVVPTPDRAFSFDLRPNYAYPFPSESTLGGGLGLTLLRGTLHTTDGRGVAGATLQVVGTTEPCVTDATGQWVLVFPDTQASGNVTVRVVLPGGAAQNVAGVPVVRGREAGLGETALRGWLLSAAGGVIPGATVQVQGFADLVTAGLDGGWFYYFDLNQAAATVSVTATLPDGRSQTQINQQVRPRATVVVPTFRFA